MAHEYWNTLLLASTTTKTDSQGSLHLQDTSNIRRSNGDEKHFSKFSSIDADARPRITGQNINRTLQCDGIDLVVVAGDTFVPADFARDGGVIAMIVLRTKTEAGDGAIVPYVGLGLVLDEIRDGEVLALDPERAGAFHGWKHHHTGVRYDHSLAGIVLGVDGSGAGSVLADKEVLECRVFVDVLGLKLGHVDMIKFHKVPNLAT